MRRADCSQRLAVREARYHFRAADLHGYMASRRRREDQVAGLRLDICGTYGSPAPESRYRRGDVRLPRPDATGPVAGHNSAALKHRTETLAQVAPNNVPDGIAELGRRRTANSPLLAPGVGA